MADCTRNNEKAECVEKCDCAVNDEKSSCVQFNLPPMLQRELNCHSDNPIILLLPGSWRHDVAASAPQKKLSVGDSKKNHAASQLRPRTFAIQVHLRTLAG